VTDIRILARGLGFPEGPVAMPDGAVILTEINGGRITRVDAAGTVTRLGPPGGGPNGIAVGPDGMLYVCNNGGARYLPGSFMGQGPSDDYAGGSIERVDPKTGARTTLYREVNGHRLSAPNDLVFDRQGGFWFTDLGKVRRRDQDRGAVYWARADGSEIREVIQPMVHPNGIGLSPDGATLYVAESLPGRLWAFEVAGPGAIRRQPWPSPNGGRLVCGLPDYQLFDSLAVEAGGNICCATLVRGAITVVAPDGRVVEQVAMGDHYTTNLCFGGPDLRTAFVTLSHAGRLVSLDWPRPGLRLAY
jgi:gluconolactonase